MTVLRGCTPWMPDLGVTPGGQQDIAAARRAIESGEIPDPDWITVEGFMSEHNIPVDPPDDAGLLYVTTGVAWNADFDVFVPVANVTIGFGTNLNAETFQRDALNLCLVIDRSGSMDDVIDARSNTTKLDAVKIAVDRLLAQLDGNDLVSIVSFDEDSTLWVEAVPGDDIVSIKSALDEITAEGWTDLRNGVRRGYHVAREHRDAARSNRLIVFTDAMLTVSPDSQAEALLDLMETYADDEIGATILAVGVEFDQEVAYEIAQVRGGNYFFLSDYDRIVSVFEEEFDYLVTPVAYDVTLNVSVPYEWDVTGVYGLSAEEPFPHMLELSIPTLFLSTRQGGGGVLIRIRPGALVDFEVANTVADISFSYTGSNGEQETYPAITATMPAGWDSTGGGSYFSSYATRRAVLLLNTALVMQNACRESYLRYDGYYYYYGGEYTYDRDRAVERLTEFFPYFDSLAEGLDDSTSDASRSLSEERALVVKLLANIRGY